MRPQEGMIDGHAITEHANLLIHRKIVGIVDAQPNLLAQVRSHIDQAINETGGTLGELLWQSVLLHSWEKVREHMLDPGPDGRLLRSNTPFITVIDPIDTNERRRIWRQARDELIAESYRYPTS